MGRETEDRERRKREEEKGRRRKKEETGETDILNCKLCESCDILILICAAITATNVKF